MLERQTTLTETDQHENTYINAPDKTETKAQRDAAHLGDISTAQQKKKMTLYDNKQFFMIMVTLQYQLVANSKEISLHTHYFSSHTYHNGA